MKEFFEEFRKFITRGNVIDMSVGVIVGGAFTSIVNTMTESILRPVINWVLALIIGSDSLTGVYTYLKEVKVVDSATGEEVVEGIHCINLKEAPSFYVEGPVVLAAAAGHYELPLMPMGEEYEATDNLLGGTLKAAPVDGNVFVFENGVFKKKTGTGNVAANKVYYVSETDATTFEVQIKDETPTAIEGIATSNNTVKFYDLNGRPVAKPANGIFVTSDGRKVLVK